MRAKWAMLALWLPAVATAMTGEEYLAHCQKRTTYDQAACMGYLDALLEGRLRKTEVAALDTFTMHADPYCLPHGAHLKQIRPVVVAGLTRLPAAQRKLEARGLIVDVLSKTYPAANCDS